MLSRFSCTPSVFLEKVTITLSLEMLFGKVVFNRRDGLVVRASASQSVDLGLIPLVESYRKI